MKNFFLDKAAFKLLMGSFLYLISNEVARGEDLSAPVFFGKAGVWGSFVRGNTRYLEIGNYGETGYQWQNRNKLSAKIESYFWKGGPWNSLKVKGSARYDQSLSERWAAFLLFEGKMDDKQNILREFTESPGVSWQMFKDKVWLETKIGHRHTKFLSKPVVDSVIQALNLNMYFPITSILFLRFENAFEYPIYGTERKKYMDMGDFSLWNRLRPEVKIAQNVTGFVEIDSYYYARRYPYVESYDVYTRFGLDLYW